MEIILEKDEKHWTQYSEETNIRINFNYLLFMLAGICPSAYAGRHSIFRETMCENISTKKGIRLSPLSDQDMFYREKSDFIIFYNKIIPKFELEVSTSLGKRIILGQVLKDDQELKRWGEAVAARKGCTFM